MPARLPRLLADPAPQAPNMPAVAFGDSRGLSSLGAATKEVAQFSATIHDSRMRAQEAANTSGASVELARIQQDLEASGDYENSEQLYQAKRKEIIDRYRKGLTGDYARSYDARMQDISERIGLQVRHDSITKGNEHAQSKLDESLENWSTLAGATRDPGLQATYRANASADIDAAVAKGFLRPTEGQNAKEQWNKNLDLANWHRRFRTGTHEQKMEAIQALERGEGPFNPTEREALIQRGMDEDLAQRREARIEAEHNEAMYRRGQRDRVEQAERNWIVKASAVDDNGNIPKDANGNPIVLTQADVLRMKDNPEMSSDAFRFYLGVAANGGRIQAKGGEINRGLFADFYERSQNLQTEEEVAAYRADLNTAFVAGEFGPDGRSAYETLNKMQNDDRDKDARAELGRALHVGDQMLGSDRWIAQFRGMEATIAFENWLRATPDHTREQAIAQAKALARRAHIADIPVAGHITPQGAVLDPNGNLLEDPSRENLMRLHDSGAINDVEYANEILFFNSVLEAQKLQQQTGEP